MTTINTFRFPEEDMVIHIAEGDLTENTTQEVNNPLEKEKEEEKSL